MSPSNFDSFINDERYAQTLHMALRKEFGENKAETMATMKIGGFLETFKKNLKFTATRKDMIRFFKIVEQNRIDKKFGLTKQVRGSWIAAMSIDQLQICIDELKAAK